MYGRLLKLTPLFLLAAAFLGLQATLILAFPIKIMVVSYPFMILAPLLALAACCWRAWIAEPAVRLSWILLTIGMLLWCAGVLTSAQEELLQHLSDSIAFASDFAFFLYGAPILLAISLPAEEQRVHLFIWLDGIQVTLTAYLTYVALFASIPFSSIDVHPISTSLLALVFDIENFALACAATLRVIARTAETEEDRFFRILCGFLWTYAVCAWSYNHAYIISNHHSVFDLFEPVPFLWLMIATLLSSVSKRKEGRVHAVANKNSLSLFIDNGSPVFYTLALLALGVVVIRAHFYTGILSILVALSVYAIRTTVLQSRYMQSQDALRDARDRMQEMSLKDGLTNIANRRCFDQVLEQELDRAARNLAPLSLLLIDIDHFKELNDRRGHRHGDSCLVAIAAALQSVLIRSGDLLARYGGEEFAVILPSTDGSGARSVAEKMQKAIQALHIANKTSTGDYVTLSIGIAVYQAPQASTPGAFIEASDGALYRAKQAGRNCIQLPPMQQG